jgi:hypothetical protein
MITFFTKPAVRNCIVGGGVAGLAFVAPFAQASCAKVSPDHHRCGDIGQVPGGLVQMLGTATSSGPDIVVVPDQTIGEERTVLPPEYTKFRRFQDARANPKVDL